MNEFPENLEGRTFENWSLQKKLGSGHSGVVYRATRGQQQAAVKIFRPALLQKGSEEALARIQRQLLQMPTDHSSLVRVLDGGKSKGGQLYLVMDYVEGLTLDTPSARNMPTDRIAPILAQIADAARYLEEQEIVHRDIKPANIIVDKEFRRATLVDYGVIRPINDVEDLTDDSSYRGDFLGTPRYSPHEFWHRQEDHSTEGWRAVTFYQLGAVAHDLITGKPLFEGVTRHELGEAVRNTVPDLSPNRIRDGVLRETVELVRKCLDKDETKRPVAWEEFDCRRYVRRPLVILVYTGGTIGARVHNDGTDIRHLRDIKKPDDPFLVNFLRRIVRDHGQLAGPDAPLPFDLRWELLAPKKQLLSENASHETWEDLSVLIEGICGTYAPREESIRSEPSQYLAGIIVLHGTDTLAYSAAALSLSLSSLPCPVVLTGSNQPPNEQNVLEQDLIASESDAWKNVLFSLQFIQTFGHRFTEVFVCFNDTVHVGVNLRKSMIDHSPQPLQREARVLQEPFFFRNYGPLRKYAYRVIDSLYCNNLYPISKQLNYAVLTGDGTNRLRHVRQSAWSPAENVRRLRFAEGVRFVQASPLAFAPLDLSDCRVVLLEGYDSGTFPTIEGHSFRKFLNELKERAIPIVQVTRNGLVPTSEHYATSLRMPLVRLFGLLPETAAPLLSLILGQIPDAEWKAESRDVSKRLAHRVRMLEQGIREFQRGPGGIFRDLMGDVLNAEQQGQTREQETDHYEREHVSRITSLFAESKAGVMKLPRHLPFDKTKTTLKREHFLWLLSELVYAFGTAHSGPDGLKFWNQFGFAWGSLVRDTLSQLPSTDEMSGDDGKRARRRRRLGHRGHAAGAHTPFAQQDPAERKESIRLARVQERVLRLFLCDHGVADLSTDLEIKPPTETTGGRLTLDVRAKKYTQGGRNDELYAAIGNRGKEKDFFRLLRDGAAPTLKGEECRTTVDEHFGDLFHQALKFKVSPLDWFLIGTYKALACGLLRKLHFDPWVHRCDSNEQNHVEALRQSIETRLHSADENGIRFELIYAGRRIVKFE